MSAGKRKNGQVALSTVLVISVIIIEIAIGGATIAADMASTANSQRASSQALSDARAGADDAFERIARYKNCPGTLGCFASSSITIDSNDVANVTISTSGSCSAGTITVISEGVSSNRRRKLQMCVSVSSFAGLATVESIKEISD